MGPNRHANRMWMFPGSGLQLDGRTTYLNHASYQFRVVFIGCTGLEPQRSASSLHILRPRTRGTEAEARWPVPPDVECAGELWA